MKKLNEEVEIYFKETLEKLKPLINALNKATPFLEIVNVLTGMFFGKRKKKND